jgi:hypothetical protein
VTLPLVSASQITLYRECNRKWGWRYLQKVETPLHPAAALGIEVDDTQLQPYLRDGRAFDFTRASGHIAAAGLAYLPKPQTPGLVVQKHFTMPSPTWVNGEHIGFGYQGYIDLWLPDSALVPDMPGGAPFVGDFKTTSDVYAWWVKDEEKLKTDVQAMLYATHAMYTTKKKEVDLAWIYFQTRGPKKTRRIHLRVASDHVAEQFESINETAIEMYRVRNANPHPLELTPNTDMCGEYRGCPHRFRCNLSPAQVFGALEAKESRELASVEMTIMSNQTTSYLDKLKARKAAAQTGLAPSPAVPSVTAPQPSAPSPTLEEHVAQNPRAAFLMANTPAVPALQAADPRYTIIGQRPDGSPIYTYELSGTPGPVNPPESQLAPAPAVSVAPTSAPAEAPKRRGRPPAAAKVPAEASAPVPAKIQNMSVQAAVLTLTTPTTAELAQSLADFLKMQREALQTYEEIFRRLGAA